MHRRYGIARELSCPSNNNVDEVVTAAVEPDHAGVGVYIYNFEPRSYAGVLSAT